MASNTSMGRSVWCTRGFAAAALMASCLAVTASAQQAPAPPVPAGSTSAGSDDAQEPEGLPTSLERVRAGLERQPVLRLESQPIFRVAITERRPRYWDLQSPFLFPVEPRTTTTRWHDEFMEMVTPTEAKMYGSMLSQSETATIAATSLLFAGAASLVTAGVSEWREHRRESKARRAVEEVDAALAAWAAANTPK